MVSHPTYTAIITRKPVFLKNDLVTIRLKNRQPIRRLSKYQPSLRRIKLARLILKKLAIPNLLLRLPIDDRALLHGSPKLDLPEIAALFKLGSDVDFARAVAGDDVGNDARLVDFSIAYKAGFDGCGAVVEDEGGRWALWGRRFGFASSGHGDCRVGKVGDWW